MEEQPPVPMRTSDTQEQFNVKMQNWMGVWKNNVTIWNNNLPALNTGLNAALAVVYALPSIETVIPELSNITTVAGIAADVSAVSEVKESVVTCATNLPAIIAAPAAAAQAAQSATNAAADAAQSAADAAATAATLHLPVLTAADTGKTLVWDGSAQQWGTSYTAPVGTIVMYPVDLPEPDGWLRCNGGTFEATEYPELALALNGTILPNSGRTVADIHFIDSGSGLKKWETLAVNPTSGDIWASTHGSGAQPVYVQRGGTGEWINMGALSSNYSLYSIAVEKISGDVWACGKNFVSVLRGGTGSWVTVNASLVTNRIINVVYFNGTNRHAIAYSVDKSLYWSLDNGKTWKSQADMPFDASTVTWIGAYGNSQLMVASRSSIVFVDSVDSSIVQNPNLFGYGIYDDVNDMIYGYSIDEDVMNVVHKDPNYRTKIKVPMRFERSPIINPYNFDLIMPLSSVYGFPFMYLSNNKIQTFYAPYNKLIQFKGCAFCKENEIVFCGSTIDHPIYRMKLDLCQEIIKAK